MGTEDHLKVLRDAIRGERGVGWDRKVEAAMTALVGNGNHEQGRIALARIVVALVEARGVAAAD